MADALIHLVCGPTGAGKTTYALRLAEELRALRFSIDEWMTALFWMDTPQPLDPAWSISRVERCYAQIWAVARQAAERGVPCVLDLGFGEAASRARFAGLAAEAGLPARLHLADAPPEERWARVEARNRDGGATHQLAFPVSRDMFDFMESRWEPPTEAEMRTEDGEGNGG